MPARTSQPLRSLPVQFIELPDALILKRGATELKLEGAGASEAAHLIFSAARDGMTAKDLTALFAPSSRPIVDNLVHTLLSKGFLVNGTQPRKKSSRQETPIDVFYWHFGHQTRPFLKNVNRTSLTLIGMNHLSKQIAAAFLDSGIKNFRIVDHPLLRHEQWFSKNGKLKKNTCPRSFDKPLPYDTWLRGLPHSSSVCLVVASDFGPSPVFREVNQLAHQHGLAWLPVILHNLIGQLGPLILPGETACYACLHLRQNSHHEHFDVRRAVEEQSHAGQDIVGFHPSMVAMLANQAVMELLKFHGGLLPAQSVGNLMELDFLSSRLSLRKIWKVPRCPVCSPMFRHGSTMAKKTLYALDEETPP